jgi:hypothetical protein
MVPAGYLWKRVIPPPAWLASAPTRVKDVCSVSVCVNDNVVDPVDSWQHNSFGFANSPHILASLARRNGADLDDATLFFYAAYEFEFHSDGWIFEAGGWRPRSPDPSAGVPDDVVVPRDPASLILVGYDVVVRDYGTVHSPLSCNAIAKEIMVNEHCLFDDFDQAKEAVDAGKFGGCEQGEYTIFSVHSVAIAGV